MEPHPEYIAPLNISNGKAQSQFRNGSFSTRIASNQRLFSALKTQLRMTPPLTPHSSREDMVDRSNSERSAFPNYLRAFYPFHPGAPISSATVTLPLDQGDLVLVHSVHTNGWADGTLLDTGARGWLPTNYCEAYDQQLMRPLLKALMDFWDVIRAGSCATLHQFGNQDYMRGIIAGVRFLLEKSECLKREDELVQKLVGLRRNRKTLLSDLSSLAKMAKNLRDIANGAPLDDSLDSIFDQMLLKAFKIVTRGVRFLDVWNEEVGLSRVMAELSPSDSMARMYDEPLTPPVESSFSISSSAWGSTQSSTPESAISAASRMETRSRINGSFTSRAASQLSYNEPNQRRHSTIQTKRSSVSHRISYTATSSTSRNPNLASERLNVAIDDFLGVLGSFIGLHLHSRSSTELIVTTQQAVQSCRVLLSVVEEVWEHDLHRSEALEEAKDTMYERITELVHAARDAFRPANGNEDETIFMPDEGKRLVDAATVCVRGAGDCVAKARQVLEQVGDFEIEAAAIGLGISTPDVDKTDTTTDDFGGALDTETPPKTESLSGNDNKSEIKERSTRLPPPLQIPSGSLSTLSLTPSLTTDGGTTPSPSFITTAVETPTSTLDEPFSAALSSFSDLNDSLIPSTDLRESQDLDLYLHTKSQEAESQNEPTRGVTSAESERTCVNNIDDTETADGTDDSTRVSTPVDSQPPPPPLKDDVASLHHSGGEDAEESEECILEKTYAHELMFKDGQVIGGSLRALIEKLTAHESTPDAMFVSTFYLTFRHFATPVEFAEALIDRYDYIGDNSNAGGPVRLRVSNIFKGWLEAHWRHDCDDVALPCILNFARSKLLVSLPTAGRRLVELVEKVSDLHGPLVPRLVSSMGKTNTSIAQYINPDQPLPSPIISKSQMNLLKQWRNGGQNITILDFDPMELARQLTLKESRIFCSILPEELLGTEWMKKTGSLAVNVRAMSTLSTDLANLVADCILQLDEPKKRALVIKQWVKIASKCLELNNYDSLMAIICSLNSSTISRLKRTWELVSQKTKNILETLREIVDVSRNYAVLRHRIQNHVPPCLPFVGTYLTDLTFVDHGNQDTRTLTADSGSIEVINFDKHMKTAKIISELQRFQIPYRLTEVPELQTWIQDQLVRVRSAGEKGFQNYYRRSLILEPRERSTPRNSPGDANAFSLFSRENAKEKFDFLAWTQSSKIKAAVS
ncbi:SH3 domain containing protein [Coccidioides posadasii C735 delta SOWgp]|uniref:SH3 domain containing protein n=1 Tax=Coccidioides posadasii (strain C735) TaxID=222929 RepID=C5P8M4_COCP7|nr:SH3 domain containing protein [Coccidioides posadasii C735 delta SOWgp]EER26086.1 SH3 domain containing protein [Coccidioides posadasii C735 delta SOWgp]|eukprot:XP_003068231.1 SH3 domain containing protein [Coccidioides posadasii C735 delta SOWgp]